MSEQDPPRTKRTRRARPRPLAGRKAEDRFQSLLGRLPVGVYRTTPDGRIVEANAVLALMLGFKSPRALLSRNVRDFYVHDEDRAEHMAELASEPMAVREYMLRRSDGRRFWVRDHSRRVSGPDGSTRHYDGILLDITERKTAERRLQQALRKLQQSNEQLESLSLTDHLTGLNNRRGFYSFGLQQMKIAKRLKKDNYLVFLDIDCL